MTLTITTVLIFVAGILLAIEAWRGRSVTLAAYALLVFALLAYLLGY